MLPEEPLPIRLMNTVWAGAGEVHDDFHTPSDVDEWLDAVGIDRNGASASLDDFDDAVQLRDAVRTIAGHQTADTRPLLTSIPQDIDDAVQVLNMVASRGPSVMLLRSGNGFQLGAGGDAPPIGAALADVARSSIDLLGGDDAPKVRACNAPGCVLYFVQSHPRREWCSVMCGNRARAARHYEKVRELRNIRTLRIEEEHGMD
ncbi:CGNR zinc finger domain-containing protein [Humibacter soli]